MNSLLLTDGYKTGHHQQYPDRTTLVYSNWTPRSVQYAPEGVEKILSFGQQYMIRFLHNHFEENFFSQDKEEVCDEIKKELSLDLGVDYDVSHFEDLHDLGYLPIRVKSLPEGIEVPVRTPMLTIVNTLPRFYWVTNYLETIISSLLWLPMTSATTALRYKRTLTEWAKKTDESNVGFVDFQGHDFSMRGMSGLDAVVASGIGHGIVFAGSDSLPAIHGLRQYYDANGFILGSVNATEHSVMCAGGKEDELGTIDHLLKTYPTGILSVVSDTWDLWKVLTEYMPARKEQIMSRDGKFVVRPDSGDPVDILCGRDPIEGVEQRFPRQNKPEYKGVIELLWGFFGGTINKQGYKVLDPHVGAIYGDSITPERAEQICRRLEAKGFASTNVVLGIGSFTYQFKTRDTLGFAMKATYVEVDGESREIFKDPVTDNGMKKSAKGLIRVNEDLTFNDQVTWEEEDKGELWVIYEDGITELSESYQKVKSRINSIL